MEWRVIYLLMIILVMMCGNGLYAMFDCGQVNEIWCWSSDKPKPTTELTPKFFSGGDSQINGEQPTSPNEGFNIGCYGTGLNSCTPSFDQCRTFCKA